MRDQKQAMYKYLPKQWKLRIAGNLTLLLALIAGLPLMFSVALVVVAKLWPVLLPMAILVLACRILARWRR